MLLICFDIEQTCKLAHITGDFERAKHKKFDDEIAKTGKGETNMFIHNGSVVIKAHACRLFIQIMNLVNQTIL